jgi:hypothetical protein
VLRDAENYLGGLYCWAAFPIDDAVAFCERSRCINELGDRLLWAYGQTTVYARRHAFRGEFDEARTVLDRAEGVFRELGSALGRSYVIVVRADVSLLAGDRDALRAVLREADEPAPGAATRERWDELGIAGELACFWMALGDADAAERWLAALTTTSPGGPEADLPATGARLRVLLLRGRVQEALEVADRTTTAARADGLCAWLDGWSKYLDCAADVFEAAGWDAALRSTLAELANAYRVKGNLVALERVERRLAGLPG